MPEADISWSEVQMSRAHSFVPCVASGIRCQAGSSVYWWLLDMVVGELAVEL